eukprot:TRINITY_DN560_c0_g1_i2.p1 TRINITY_DN560_c0_g1~~TRINITY_DN560_c0_g1_i2.p1  ORF type:complete len:794 (+),score=237.14 TRINITY_DN560_c0_g1_i2:49-2430(+)
MNHNDVNLEYSDESQSVDGLFQYHVKVKSEDQHLLLQLPSSSLRILDESQRVFAELNYEQITTVEKTPKSITIHYRPKLTQNAQSVTLETKYSDEINKRITRNIEMAKIYNVKDDTSPRSSNSRNTSPVSNRSSSKTSRSNSPSRSGRAAKGRSTPSGSSNSTPVTRTSSTPISISDSGSKKKTPIPSFKNALSKFPGTGGSPSDKTIGTPRKNSDFVDGTHILIAHTCSPGSVPLSVPSPTNQSPPTSPVISPRNMMTEDVPELTTEEAVDSKNDHISVFGYLVRRKKYYFILGVSMKGLHVLDQFTFEEEAFYNFDQISSFSIDMESYSKFIFTFAPAGVPEPEVIKLHSSDSKSIMQRIHESIRARMKYTEMKQSQDQDRITKVANKYASSPAFSGISLTSASSPPILSPTSVNLSREKNSNSNNMIKVKRTHASPSNSSGNAPLAKSDSNTSVVGLKKSSSMNSTRFNTSTNTTVTDENSVSRKNSGMIKTSSSESVRIKRSTSESSQTRKIKRQPKSSNNENDNISTPPLPSKFSRTDSQLRMSKSMNWLPIADGSDNNENGSSTTKTKLTASNPSKTNIKVSNSSDSPYSSSSTSHSTSSSSLSSSSSLRIPYNPNDPEHFLSPRKNKDFEDGTILADGSVGFLVKYQKQYMIFSVSNSGLLSLLHQYSQHVIREFRIVEISAFETSSHNKFTLIFKPTKTHPGEPIILSSQNNIEIQSEVNKVLSGLMAAKNVPPEKLTSHVIQKPKKSIVDFGRKRTPSGTTVSISSSSKKEGSPSFTVKEHKML